MKRVTALLVLIAVVATSLVVATSGAPPDVVSAGETDVLELDTVPESAGTYARINEDTGEIEVVLTEDNPAVDGDGVNPEATTDVGPVFQISNVLEREPAADVWIEHDGEGVEFYADRCGTCIDSRDQAVRLEPGESVTVGLRVDTRGVDEKVLLSIITVMAQLESPVESGSEEAGSSASYSASQETPTKTPADTPTDTPTTTPTETEMPTSTSTDTPEGTVAVTATPTDDTPSTATPTDDTPSTATDAPDEEAGFDPWLIVGLAAVACAVGGGLLLTRRLGYL